MTAEHANLTPDTTGMQDDIWLLRGKIPWLVVGGLWLFTACYLLASSGELIREPRYIDPDDALRIVQVRDFLAGQSWFDVTQYRSYAPYGAEMHWSRLVDLPLAGAILLLRPFLGPEAAELVTAVIIPLLTLAALFASLFWSLRGPFGTMHAMVCCLLLMVTPTILYRLEPLRVDHHGWQMVMAAIVIGGVIHRHPRIGGSVAGLAMAVSLRISSEGLPFATIVGAALTLRYVLFPAEGTRLLHYVWVLVLASAGLLVATEGVEGALQRHCDTMSIVYLGPMSALSVLLSLAYWSLGDRNQLRRMIPVLLGLAVGTSVFLFIGKSCLSGPFGEMAPLVRSFWYEGVYEGLPVWKIPKNLMLLVILPALPGLIGLGGVCSVERDPARRINWLSLLVLAVGACAVALGVFRAISVAHLTTLPGLGWLILIAVRRIFQMGSPLLRVFSTVSLTGLTPISLMVAAKVLSGHAELTAKTEKSVLKRSNFISLRQLETSTLFAPFDIGPQILLETGHSVIATGHHRNLVGMEIVVRAFLAETDEARAIVEQSGANYVLLANKLPETLRYIERAPDGLAAHLVRGDIPDWMVPVKLNDLGQILLFRIY